MSMAGFEPALGFRHPASPGYAFPARTRCREHDTGMLALWSAVPFPNLTTRAKEKGNTSAAFPIQDPKWDPAHKNTAYPLRISGDHIIYRLFPLIS